MNVNKKLGMIGSFISAISVILFAICMLIPFDFVTILCVYFYQ